MPTTTLRRLVLFVLGVCTVVVTSLGVLSGPAAAHNSLVSTDPADGATLAVAPTEITWLFDTAVPLETMTVTLIDATGTRTELAGSVHGAAGDTEVVTPLPALQPGEVSVRWRLVGPDGHPVTGRVQFVVTAAASSGVAPDVSLPDASAVPPPSTAELSGAVSSVDTGDGSYSTSSVLRWVLRYASYLAIMAVVGILLTSAYVWSGAGSHPLLRQVLSGSLIAIAVLGFLQLLVIASDVSGAAPWASFGSIDAAMTTDAGMAFVIRIVLALVMWMVLFQYQALHPDVYWTAVSFPALGLLATWAFAGHARSMRWPTIGVLTDVAHHAAAAAWIGGLAIVGWIVIPRAAPDVLVPAVRRFSRAAAISVAVLVGTGLLQTVRLVGGPADLLAADHGRYLAIKLVFLAAMLGVANANRRRVASRLDDAATRGGQLGSLRKAVVTEFAIGLVIIAITAAMVVSPPSTSDSDARAATASPGYYTVS
jgi:copper transport protein